MKLVKVTSTNGVDIALMAVPDDATRFQILDHIRASQIMTIHGELYLDETVDLPPQLQLDEWRPFVG